MGKIYNGLGNAQQVNVTSASPLDVRLSVMSLSDLFNWDNETFGSYYYKGMPVIVVKNNNQWNDPANGLYVLLDINKIKYLYDPRLSNEECTAADTQNRIPGKSNVSGWAKVAFDFDLPNLDMPSTVGDYVLTVTENGFRWTDNRLVPEIPSSNPEGKVLTVIEVPNAEGEYMVAWADPQGGSQPYDPHYPSTPGRYVLRIATGEDPAWVEEATASGISIKNFSGSTDIDPNTGRHIPSTGGTLTEKRILSNSGEIIATDVESSESQDTGSERPFRLMLNYEALTGVTINGGNAFSTDPITWTLTVRYNDASASETVRTETHVYADGARAQYTPEQRFKSGNYWYSLAQSYLPIDMVMSADSSVTYQVNREPVWNPAVKYAVSSNDFSGYPWTDDPADYSDPDEMPVLLTETAPSDTTAEEANGDTEKYFYMTGHSIFSSSFTSVKSRIRIEDSSYTNDIEDLSYWDGLDQVWKTIPESDSANVNPRMSKSVVVSPNNTTEFDLTVDYYGNYNTTLAYRFKIIKRENGI